MKQLFNLMVIVAGLNLADAYSKYGRTCNDIGCPSNQVCVLKEKPCELLSNPKQCGKYPACVRVSNNAPSCASYVCPPTMSCRMDRGVPKCFASKSKSNRPGRINVNPANYPLSPRYSNYESGYGQTTQRPNVYQSGQRVNGGGYHGGVIGSGYPGQGGNPRGYGYTTLRPNVYQTGQRVSGGGYQGGVIGSGYPGQTGYQRQGNGYPQQTYQYGGYSNGNSGRGYGQRNNYQSTGQDESNAINALSKFLKTNFNVNV